MKRLSCEGTSFLIDGPVSLRWSCLILSIKAKIVVVRPMIRWIENYMNHVSAAQDTASEILGGLFSGSIRGCSLWYGDSEWELKLVWRQVLLAWAFLWLSVPAMNQVVDRTIGKFLKTLHCYLKFTLRKLLSGTYGAQLSGYWQKWMLFSLYPVGLKVMSQPSLIRKSTNVRKSRFGVFGLVICIFRPSCRGYLSSIKSASRFLIPDTIHLYARDRLAT